MYNEEANVTLNILYIYILYIYACKKKSSSRILDTLNVKVTHERRVGSQQRSWFCTRKKNDNHPVIGLFKN